VTKAFVPASLGAMPREISAGGVLVRGGPGGWEVAVIEPQREPQGNQSAGGTDKKRHKQVLALPKGLVDPGEKADATAVREVREETGITGSIITKLLDIKYVYVRTWGDKQRVFKIVSFYLLRYESGEIDDVSPEMRIEVRQALWIPLDEAEKKLSYRGERDAVRKAKEYLQSSKDTR
jgi:8-oxo-dGTP pyrophosphatase MutT (NUDIX family)